MKQVIFVDGKPFQLVLKEITHDVIFEGHFKKLIYIYATKSFELMFRRKHFTDFPEIIRQLCYLDTDLKGKKFDTIYKREDGVLDLKERDRKTYWTKKLTNYVPKHRGGV